MPDWSITRLPLSKILLKRNELACITETWLTLEVGRGRVSLTEMCPAGFRVWHQLRPQDRGHGVAVVIKESLLAFRDIARHGSVRP